MDRHRCPSCLQRNAFEIERRCLHCDEPRCAFCIVEVRTRGELVRLCEPCRGKERKDARAVDLEG